MMKPAPRLCYQINLQLSLGGGEIYTRFLTQALANLQYRNVLLVHPEAHFWSGLRLPGCTRVPVRSMREIEAAINAPDALTITHSALPEAGARVLAERTTLVGVLHMPLYERFPQGLRQYHRLWGVSRHVINSAKSRGLDNVAHEPLYAVADISPRDLNDGNTVIQAASRYDWDARKFRDRLLGRIESLGQMLRHTRPRPVYAPRPGLTLGIVSRITPIKQFPELFSILSPIIRRHSEVHLEIFGSGGYASIRDLTRALAPIAGQVRFWGQQSDVARVYAGLDYVLSGLPEKEALGLNLIEAQVCGTPVLAIDAPPFDETVIDGVSGFLYEDPRRDAGKSFALLLERLVKQAALPGKGETLSSSPHLARFSAPAFQARLSTAIDALKLPPKNPDTSHL